MNWKGRPMMNNKPSRPFKPLDSDEERNAPVGCLISFICGIAAIICIIANLIYRNLP
jgi:hypothetical protein